MNAFRISPRSPSLRPAALVASAALAAAIGLSLCGGCAVGPKYTPPRIETPNTFSSTATQAPESVASQPMPAQEPAQRWWTTFRDRELDFLIDRAVRSNRDLKLAASRVRQARAERAMLGGALLPEVDVGGGYNRGHGSNNVALPFGGGGSASTGSTSPSPAPARGAASGRAVAAETRSDVGSGGNGGGVSTATPAPSTGKPVGPQSPFGQGGLPGVTTSLYQAGFDASWEIDLFGGARRAIEAANARVQAAEEDQYAVLVSLLGEVAQTYIQLRSTQRRIEIAQQNVAAQKEVLSISQAKFRAGFETDLNVQRQIAQLQITAASIPAEEAEVRTALHALAYLIGAEPDALAQELSTAAPLPDVPPQVPVGVPSDLLRRRPDVRSAERQLAAATANVGVATAELFPRFSLTGSLGVDSSRLADLPKWSSHYYSIIPGVSWPILDWGRARANVRVQNEIQQQALNRYESAVAQALRDVEDALVRYQYEQTRRTALDAAVKAAHNAFGIARQQFEHGVVDETVVLDAQRSMLSAEDALALSDAAIRTDLVSLYKALGGGWEILADAKQT